MITFKDFRAMNNVLPNCDKFRLENIATILGVSMEKYPLKSL